MQRERQTMKQLRPQVEPWLIGGIIVSSLWIVGMITFDLKRSLRLSAGELELQRKEQEERAWAQARAAEPYWGR